VRRSLALIAVATAVAVAAAVVVAGMNSGGGGDAGAATSQTPGALPSGHPSISASDETTEPPAGDADSDDTALADLEAKHDEDPDDVQALLDLGDAYFMRLHLRQAAQAYTEALTQDPDSTAAQVGLAMVWHAEGDSKRAEKTLADLVQAHPDDQDAHYSLAIVYFSSGRVDEAKIEWQTAARIDPGSTTGRRSQSFVDLLEDTGSSSPSAN
jgi:cytochrome c-type biogenesis protein CcmH/NrfG